MNITYTKEELQDIGMKPHAIKAFLELQKLGCPVKAPIQGDDRGHFWISAEEENSGEWLDYYAENSLMFGDESMNEILQEKGLYWEWYNPAYGNVYDI